MTLHLSELEMQLLLANDDGRMDIYGFVKTNIEKNAVVILRSHTIPAFDSSQRFRLVTLSGYETLLSEPTQELTGFIPDDNTVLNTLLYLCPVLTIGPEKYSDCTYVLSGVDVNISLLIKRTTERLLAERNRVAVEPEVVADTIHITTRANIKVAARRLNVVEPTDEQCKHVWSHLGLSGVGRRSVLAPVVYVDSLTHGDVDALAIAHLVSETWAYLNSNPVIKLPVLDEVCKLAVKLYGIGNIGNPKYSFIIDAAHATYVRYEIAQSNEEFRNRLGMRLEDTFVLTLQDPPEDYGVPKK
jgi:hypothetical protein